MKLWLLEMTDFKAMEETECPSRVVVCALDEVDARRTAKKSIKHLYRNESVENSNYYSCVELVAGDEAAVIVVGDEW